MTRAVAAVPGVLDERVDLNRDTVTVAYDPHRISPDAIAAATSGDVVTPLARVVNGHR